MYTVNAKVVGPTPQEMSKKLAEQAGQVVLAQALGAVSTLYQIYPVGAEHKDGSPHTRDTFKVIDEKGHIYGEKGNFSGDGSSYVASKDNKLKLLTAGASFFLEWGTIFMEPQPLIRMIMKRAQQTISNALKKLNLKLK